MTDDDDLRDRFGDELTEALRARAHATATVPPVDTVDTVEHRVHRARPVAASSPRSRRQLSARARLPPSPCTVARPRVST